MDRNRFCEADSRSLGEEITLECKVAEYSCRIHFNIIITRAPTDRASDLLSGFTNTIQNLFLPPHSYYIPCPSHLFHHPPVPFLSFPCLSLSPQHPALKHPSLCPFLTKRDQVSHA